MTIVVPTLKKAKKHHELTSLTSSTVNCWWLL